MRMPNTYNAIFRAWRARRHKIFLEKIRPTQDQKMLDLGGTLATWQNYGQPVGEITCLNTTKPQIAVPDGLKLELVAGDACDLGYGDASFDIVYSNSVIEHVGDFARQKLFAAEARRVGRRLWIQTPAQECPFEPHYMAPFVHWLPENARRKILRWGTPWGWITKPDQQTVDLTIRSTQLLTKRQFASLFPDCQIYEEKLFGFIPKSYVAYR